MLTNISENFKRIYGRQQDSNPVPVEKVGAEPLQICTMQTSIASADNFARNEKNQEKEKSPTIQVIFLLSKLFDGSFRTNRTGENERENRQKLWLTANSDALKANLELTFERPSTSWQLLINILKEEINLVAFGETWAEISRKVKTNVNFRFVWPSKIPTKKVASLC